MEGPLEILSPSVQAFLAKRAVVDPRQRCHYEDLYIGIAIAAHPSLSMVNLERLLGRKDIYNPGSSTYIGADSLIAHWVRTDDAFVRVQAGFETARRTHAAGSSQLQCESWATSFPPLREHFPCCHDWRICEPVTPLLRQRTHLVLNRSFE